MKRITPSRLFFAELLINLLFFCICAAVCVSILAGAGEMIRESDLLDTAVCEAQNAAEAFKREQGDIKRTAERLQKQTGRIVSPEGDSLKMSLENGCILFMNGGVRGGTHSARIRIVENCGKGREVFSLTTGCGR